MSEHPFDDLARRLAGAGTSRRGVLRAFAGAVLGSLVAAPPRPALAWHGNDECVRFCIASFGDELDELHAAGRCIDEAAHGRGLCYTCGPKSPGGSKPICCPRDDDGKCASYSRATCCKASQTCSHGQCVPRTTTTAAPTTTTPAPTTSTTTTTTSTTTTSACVANGGTCGGNPDCCSGNCTNGFCCASGQVGLSNGSCATTCTNSVLGARCTGACSSTMLSVCLNDVSGARFCAGYGSFGTCTSDSDCRKGDFCYLGGCWHLC